jgi:hypothetical protein
MRFYSITTLAALASVALAAPTNNFQRHVLHERREPSENWVKSDRVHSDVKLPMRESVWCRVIWTEAMRSSCRCKSINTYYVERWTKS